MGGGPNCKTVGLLIDVISRWNQAAIGRYTLEVENLRLGRLERPRMELVHRPHERDFFGRICLSSETAISSRSYYTEYGVTMSLDEYYYVQYGKILRYPQARCVYFVDVNGGVEPGEMVLVPQECVRILPEE